MWRLESSGDGIPAVDTDGSYEDAAFGVFVKSLSIEEANFLVHVVGRVRAAGPRADLRDLQNRIDAAIPSAGPDPWDELIGPFYSTPSLMIMRGVTRQAIQKLRSRMQVLWVETSDRRILYPSFQFDDRGNTIPHLGDVLQKLHEAIPDGWSLALWLNSPVEQWGGVSAAAKLRRNTAEDISDVLALASDTVANRSGR